MRYHSKRRAEKSTCLYFLAVPPIQSPYIMAAYLGWEALLLRLRSSRAGWPRASMLLVEPLPDRGLRYRL